MTSVTLLAVATTGIGLATVAFNSKGQVGRLISPFSVTMMMLIAIFGIRPLLAQPSSSSNFYGYTTTAGMETASQVGLVAVLSVACGYITYTPRSTESNSQAILTPTPQLGQHSTINRTSAKTVFTICLLVVLAWITLMAARAGGLTALQEMTGGRSTVTARLVENLPILIYCMPAAASIAASVWRLERERFGPSLQRADKLAFWAIIFIALLPPAMLGNRRFILPCVIAAVIAANAGPARWVSKIKPWQLAAAVIGFLVLAILPYVRSAGSRTNNASLPEALLDFWQQEGWSGTLTNFFSSYDTEMYDFIAYAAPRLGNTLPYGYGRGTVVDVLTSAVPSRIINTPSWSNEILLNLFNGTCTTGICPVPSFAGTAFFDFGFVGVAVAGLLLGILARTFEAKLFQVKGMTLAAILVLGSLPATAVRGNYPSQLWIGFNIFVGASIILIMIRAAHTPRADSSMHLKVGQTLKDPAQRIAYDK